MVVDNSPLDSPNQPSAGNNPLWKVQGLNAPQEFYPAEELLGADDVWRMGINLGCPCHFYPALAMYQFKYVMFADDDFVPGSNALAHLLGVANLVDDKFSTIGGTGRTFQLERGPGHRYSGRSVPRALPGLAVSCHITCRAHLVRRDLLYHFIPFRERFLAYGEEGKYLVGIHDDFLLCLGLQCATGHRSYTVERPDIADDRLFMVELDDKTDTTPLWKRPEHFKERNRMVDLSLEVGWKPV